MFATLRGQSVGILCMTVGAYHSIPLFFNIVYHNVDCPELLHVSHSRIILTYLHIVISDNMAVD